MDVNTGSGHLQPHAGAGSQIRSRVTVVCAECKRLKLKCDRRTPCSSCLKRDTVLRCTYSAAAAEKIDVQSLHNRMLVIESQLAQVSSDKIKLSSHDTDHALLAVGSSGSSVLVPMDDVTGLWLEHLDLGRDSGTDLQPVFTSDSEGRPPLDYLRLASPPSSHVGSLHGSPHPASTSASVTAASPANPSPTDAIPSTFLGGLPSAQQRPALLDTLGLVLRMHPSLNFPHFCVRINAMFTDGVCAEEIGIGTPHADHGARPTLSFFAAAAAGFALAVQCSPPPTLAKATTSPHEFSPPAISSSPPSVSSLLALSTQALDLAETSAPYDLDFVHALVLRGLCLLHDATPRVNQTVFANLGKMVNITRLMGLARDPDEFAGKYTLWEAEMRRRMWWDVFYYDVFISDFTGHTPLLADDQYTCRMPADVDEDAFLPKSAVLPPPSDRPGASNSSYFVQKCKLAQLVKNTKKRPFHDPSSSPSPPAALPADQSIDAVSQAESDIHQYLTDLPPAFKLDIDAGPTDPSYGSAPPTSPPSASDKPPPYLIIQRCELVTIAHQLLLKIFHPFLRRPNVRPPDVALFASINAAHAVINASRIARSVWQDNGGGKAQMGGGPSTNILSSHGIFYPFARQLFDATIVAAHVVIQAPQSVVAKVALEDVRVGLEILRDPTIATGRGRAPSRGGVEGCPSEAVSIVEMMLRKAEMAKRNQMPVSAGTKRKHEEVEANITKGFWLPYVGTGVATESAAGAEDGSAGGAGPPRARLSEKPFAPENQPRHHGVPSASATTRERDRDRKYPTVGIRNRVNPGSVAGHKSPVGVARPRGEASLSRPPPQPPSEDPGGYARPAASSSGSTTSMPPEPMQSTPSDFHISAPYAMEDAPIVNMNVSPTNSRFTPRPQSHPYTAHSYQPTGVPGSSHRPIYDSNSYASDSSRPQQPPPFYVPYQQSAPPRQSAYQSLGDPGHTHSHSHISQPPPPPHLEIPPHLPHMILPNQNGMDTSDPPRVAKQEEGVDMHTSRSHPVGSPFSGSEGWTDAGVAARFAGPPAWEPGFGNF